MSLEGGKSVGRFVWALIPPRGGDFAKRRGAAKRRGFHPEARRLGSGRVRAWVRPRVRIRGK